MPLVILFDYMANKIIYKSNLDTATPEQKERLMKNMLEAYSILYKSVVERRIMEIINEKYAKNSDSSVS